jgi:hypothetical protein
MMSHRRTISGAPNRFYIDTGRRSRRFACSIATIAVAAISVGCTSDAVTTPNVPQAGEIVDIDPKEFTLPLDPYLAQAISPEKVAQASKVLFRRCMLRFEFVLPTEPTTAPPMVKGYERRYGLVDETTAGQFGYHVPAMVELARVGGTPSPSPSPMSAEHETVARGIGPSTVDGRRVPEGGCYGESRRTLEIGAPSVSDPRLGDRLSYDAFAQTHRDERVRSVFVKWSACMLESGFYYADPTNAVNDPAFRTTLPTDREKAVAVADVRCKSNTNVISTMAAVETAYQRLAVEENRGPLELVREYWLAQARNAERILAQ